MAYNICYPMTKVSEKNVEKVKVPTGVTLYGGSIVMCETLDTTSSANREVYLGAAVVDKAVDFPCLVINQGFEQLSDGRRPEGNPNPGRFEFNAGDVVTSIRPEKDLKFFISEDIIDTTVALAVGQYIVPVNATYGFASIAAITTEKVALKIEKITTMAQGGQFGSEFATGVIARVVEGR